MQDKPLNTNSTESLPNQLLTWEEYFALAPLPAGQPYIINIEKNNQQLLYFSSWHTYDLDSQVARDLVLQWEQFKLHQLDPSKAKVLIEGGLRHKASKAASANDAIGMDAEMGLISYLASQDNVEIVNADAPHHYQANKLVEKGYTRDQVEYYFFIQMVHQYVNLAEGFQPPFEKYITVSLQRDRHESGWEDYDFSLDHMQQLHAQFFNRPFKLTDFDLFDELLTTKQDQIFTQKIRRDLSLIRDEHVVLTIAQYWQQGLSLFVVFGAAHAQIEERAIRAICV